MPNRIARTSTAGLLALWITFVSAGVMLLGVSAAAFEGMAFRVVALLLSLLVGHVAVVGLLVRYRWGGTALGFALAFALFYLALVYVASGLQKIGG